MAVKKQEEFRLDDPIFFHLIELGRKQLRTYKKLQNDWEDIILESVAIFTDRMGAKQGKVILSPDAYFSMIVRNAAIKKIQHMEKHPTENRSEWPELKDDGNDEGFAIDREFDALFEAMNQLGDKCQKILELFYWESLPLREIALQVDTTYGNVRHEKGKCMKRLKEKALLLFAANKNKNHGII